MSGDNFTLKFVSDQNMDMALAIVATEHKQVTHYSSCEELLFYWSDTGLTNAVALPSAMSVEDTKAIIVSWLQSAEYGKEPNIDGHSKKGFTIESGRVSAYPWQTAFLVRPTWIEYHK